MIDIHNHILPGLENGTKNMEESIQIAKAAVDHGIDTIIAAPRYINEEPTYNAARIKEQVTLVNNRLLAEQIPLVILPGQQVRLHADITNDTHRKDLLPLANGYILLELGSDYLPSNISSLIFDLLVKGLVPILAQPELHPAMQSNPNRIYRLVRKGALVQVSAGSLLGKNGSKAKKVANQLIGANLVHLIASGNHDEKKQAFHLRAAYEQIGKIHGLEATEYLLDSAERFSNGESILALEPEKVVTRKHLSFL